MDSLEGTLSKNADNLRNITDKTSQIQDQHSTEYLLGLLNMHKHWNMTEQLNATRTFADGSKEAQELLAHHDESKPLAPQLAALMDAAAAKKKAVRMFLQLAAREAPKAKAQNKTLKTNATSKAAAKPAPTQAPSEEEQLKRLQIGLSSINKLKSTFAASAAEAGNDKLASGALTAELGKSDSAVWSTITNMLTAATSIQGKMKGKSKAEQDKMMASLEDSMNSQAQVLHQVTDKASAENEKDSAEYLLGLLNQHPQWSMEKQLNATKTFVKMSPLAGELLAHHNASAPLAPQLAALMDASAKPAAPAKKAAAMLIQLVSSLREE